MAQRAVSHTAASFCGAGRNEAQGGHRIEVHDHRADAPDDVVGFGGTAGCGGSSIALFVFQPAVTLKSRLFNAADSGKGGNGMGGQTAQAGASTPAQPANSAYPSMGGLGGPGGGRDGGVSVGNLCAGTRPTIEGTAASAVDSRSEVSLGRAGAGGAKGIGGGAVRTSGTPSRAGWDGKDGPSGIAKAVIALQ